jgi:hypothetical protein
MDAVKDYLQALKIGRKQEHVNVALFPLMAPDAGPPDYLTLEEALKEGMVVITEVSEGGQVPDLKLVNRSPRAVLIVAGEELVGAKQNRIVNVTILVAGRSEMVIPVSCVEQGRWAYRGRQFDSGAKLMHASLRREHQRAVSERTAAGERFRSDQGMIWKELAAKSARMGVSSPTGAMTDLFEGQRDRLGEYLKAFRLVDCQVGAAFAINGQVLGVECFGYQGTFARFFEKLVGSYALDGLDWLVEKGGRKPSEGEVKNLLSELGSLEPQIFPSVGLGESVRLEGERVSGAVLALDDRLLHLSAFRREQGPCGERSRVGFSRFSQRRGPRPQ